MEPAPPNSKSQPEKHPSSPFSFDPCCVAATVWQSPQRAQRPAPHVHKSRWYFMRAGHGGVRTRPLERGVWRLALRVATRLQLLPHPHPPLPPPSPPCNHPPSPSVPCWAPSPNICGPVDQTAVASRPVSWRPWACSLPPRSSPSRFGKEADAASARPPLALCPAPCHERSMYMVYVWWEGRGGVCVPGSYWHTCVWKPLACVGRWQFPEYLPSGGAHTTIWCFRATRHACAHVCVLHRVCLTSRDKGVGVHGTVLC